MAIIDGMRMLFYTELNNELSKYLVATLEDGTLIGFIGCWLIFEEAHIATFCSRQKFSTKTNCTSPYVCFR
ncbi:MAG: hypothetical protein L6V95_01915 [Candidatus Melainabacteria bacterium]|nr:MAG: hypothetical protein L6V95_01915 [Candidatus Melainabacteria bacterium]